MQTLNTIGDYNLNAVLTIALVNALRYANPSDIELPPACNLDTMDAKIITMLHSDTLLNWGKTAAGNILKQKLDESNPPHMFWDIVLHCIRVLLEYNPFHMKWYLLKDDVEACLNQKIPVVMKAIFKDATGIASLHTVLTIKDLVIVTHDTYSETYCTYTDPRGNPFDFYEGNTPSDGIDMMGLFDDVWGYGDLGEGLHTGALFTPISKVLSPYVSDPALFDASGDVEKLLDIITTDTATATTAFEVLDVIAQTFDPKMDFGTFEKGLIDAWSVQLQHETCQLYHTLIQRVLSLAYGVGLSSVTLDSRNNDAIA